MVLGTSCFLHPVFWMAKQREGEMGEEVSGDGYLLLLSCDTHVVLGLAASSGRSGGDGTVTQRWANLPSCAPPAAWKVLGDRQKSPCCVV